MILLDTNGLNADFTIFLPVDEEQVAARCAAGGIDDPEAHFAKMLALRNSVEGFSVFDRLRKDYKQWQVDVSPAPAEAPNAVQNTPTTVSCRYGIASVFGSYEYVRDSSYCLLYTSPSPRDRG